MAKEKLDSALIAITKPIAPAKSIIADKSFRITVLTNRLFRIETSKEGKFIDSATQIVWYRNLETPQFSVGRSGRYVKIATDVLTLVFDIRSGNSKIIFKDGRMVDANNRGNLLGTQRTLDINFGIYNFDNGVMSKSGVAVLDDSSLILNADGEIEPRTTDTIDRYIFAYDKDYRGALKDLYRITGGVPLVPRFAFGNWWSRYHAYTQDEYQNLINRFIENDVPLTVATIDMDWHWVNINERFGTEYKGRLNQTPGWTGYSWNTDLFPDYKAFLKWLNDKGLKVTMNLHPADGIRHFEDMYEDMAREMGIDPDTKTDIPFDMTNNKFINAYFKCVHRPYEKDGVRFWWIDWQQGKKTALAGLDPLWALNHYYTLDNAREQRPLILSRYAGVGSHRYPLGFSGDTFVLWSSLKNQPYFTNNASNIGYTWWSHDIGGHMYGFRDDEMYLRWVQYGVFSPINRLHSCNSDLMSKEPWAYRDDVCQFVKDALRFRHRMIPYIYTMNYKTYSEGRALCEPMYYAYPNDESAYLVKNQYMFGSELMVCPITKKIRKSMGTADVKAWIPHGRWTDIFTGQVYSGSKICKLFRGETSIPVLAKEGAIIPLSADMGNSVDNPKNLEILAYRGNGEFTLYEDEGNDLSYFEHSVKTKFEITEENGIVSFVIHKATGDTSLIPAERNYIIAFKDIISGDVSVRINGVETSSEKLDSQPNIILNNIKPTDEVSITISNYQILANKYADVAISKIISRYQKGYVLKTFLYKNVKKKISGRNYKLAVKKSILPKYIKEEIYENLE